MNSGPPDDDAAVNPRRLENQFDPAEDVASVLATDPPRSKPDPRFRTTLDGEVPYYLIRWSSFQNTREKVYQVSGDHFYVDRLTGPGAVYIKLGPASNPWIRIRQGATYRRRFGQVRIKAPDEQTFATAECALVAYVSTGPLVENGDYMRDGFNGGFFADNTQVAGVAPTSFWGTADTQVLQGIMQTAGKNGGALIIKNTDLVNTLYLTSDLGMSFGGFPLAPGEVFTATLDGTLTTGVSSQGPRSSPFVFTLAGNCTYAYMVTAYEMDSFDNVNPGGGGINA